MADGYQFLVFLTILAVAGSVILPVLVGIFAMVSTAMEVLYKVFRDWLCSRFDVDPTRWELW